MLVDRSDLSAHPETGHRSAIIWRYGFLVDRPDARTRAQLDVIIQAGTRILSGDLPVTGQVRENPAQHIQGLVDCPDAGVGAKIPGAVVDHLAGDGHFGERHLDHGL